MCAAALTAVAVASSWDGGEPTDAAASSTTVDTSGTTPAIRTEPPVTAPTTSTTFVPRWDGPPHAWRLGYAGLGPIGLGMTFPDAQRAGNFTTRSTDGGCVIVAEPDPSVGLEPIKTPSGQVYSGLSVWPAHPRTEPHVVAEISVGHPAIYTISGIHIGDTYDDVVRAYPNAVESIAGRDADGRSFLFLTITNPAGRAIEFFFGTDRILRHMNLGLTYAVINGHRTC